MARLAIPLLLVALAAPAAAPALPATLPVALPAPVARAVPPQDEAPQSERDRQLEAEVRARLAEQEALAGIEVHVEDGVARLQGQALTSLVRTDAEARARTVPGLRDVDNRIESVWDVPGRLRPVVEHLRDRAIEIVALLPLLVIALLVLAVFWMLARGTARRRWLFARIQHPFLRELMQHVVQAAVFALGLLVALEIVGATAMVGAVLGAAGVVSLVAGLAFRDLAENYLATVLLSLRQPFEPDDHVDIAGHEGRVLRLTSRATILMTLDGNHVHVPNSMVFKGVITNYSRNPLRRFDFVAPLAKTADIGPAQERALEALQRLPSAMDDPGPRVEIASLLVDRVELRCFGWVDQREHDVEKTRSEAQRAVAAALAAPDRDGRRRAAEPAVADTRPNVQLDAQIAADRERADADLLDAGARRE